MASASIRPRSGSQRDPGDGTDSMRRHVELKGSGVAATLPADAAAKTRGTSSGVTVIHQRVRQ
jgi:hypothetical protein